MYKLYMDSELVALWEIQTISKKNAKYTVMSEVKENIASRLL